ncbi:hypothetical protein B1H38_04230 [Leptospira borgpetersenii serovar Ballum]|nr:hypothetical protein B1H38_04230 [Leptospira borgpetersenii serovar Ballum]
MSFPCVLGRWEDSGDFYIRKSYFSQVKSLTLVGILEKMCVLILIIPKSFLACGSSGSLFSNFAISTL